MQSANTRGRHSARALYGCLLLAILAPMLAWVGVSHMASDVAWVSDALCKSILSHDEQAFSSLFVTGAQARAASSWKVLQALNNVFGNVQECEQQSKGVKVSSKGIRTVSTVMLRFPGGSNARLDLFLSDTRNGWRVEDIQLYWFSIAHVVDSEGDEFLRYEDAGVAKQSR
ncbi:MAG: hypothetical protein RMM08_13845 [Armatimonadota bacterium]|nr:hypothetical protein [Armatimonadota bacterium]